MTLCANWSQQREKFGGRRITCTQLYSSVSRFTAHQVALGEPICPFHTFINSEQFVYKEATKDKWKRYTAIDWAMYMSVFFVGEAKCQATVGAWFQEACSFRSSEMTNSRQIPEWAKHGFQITGLKCHDKSYGADCNGVKLPMGFVSFQTSLSILYSVRVGVQ